MNLSTQYFDNYVFSTHSDYDEVTTRREFAQTVPLKAAVIHCYDIDTDDLSLVTQDKGA